MADLVVLSVREANLLRKRLQHLLDLRDELLKHPDEETVHDLRVSSRRAREVLDYLEVTLPQNSYRRLRRPAKKITSRLGELRETEVNQKLTEKLQVEELIPPLAAELLVHSLDNRKRKLQQKVNKQMKAGRFTPYEKFLERLKGSRMAIPASQEVLQRRAEDFYNFTLSEQMNDEQLHELRILTKKFRYALEIHNRLRHRGIGHFILRIKRLQELLGEIHDLFVFVNLIQEEARKWNDPRLTLIPEALQNAIQVVTARKVKLYPRVRVLLQKILDNTPEDIRPMPRKVVQAADAPAPEIEEMPQEEPVGQKIS
ncbi:CHAD domain-containing protein [bacterium]|nr:CHAD domain-containing protein [bacterium]MCI0605820.1 CHAD domain-containing protein [bacterium]